MSNTDELVVRAAPGRTVCLPLSVKAGPGRTVIRITETSQEAVPDHPFIRGRRRAGDLEVIEPTPATRPTSPSAARAARKE